jgi:hypothetical protein
VVSGVKARPAAAAAGMSVPPRGWPLTIVLASRNRRSPGTGSSARRQRTRSSISSPALIPETAVSSTMAAVRTMPTTATACDPDTARQAAGAARLHVTVIWADSLAGEPT